MTNETHDLATGIPGAVPQRDAEATPLGANGGEEAGGGRVVIRIIRRSCALLDPDSVAASCKYLIDQLRYAKLIKNDDPESISLEVSQEKVRHRNQQGTLVEIIS